MTQAEAKQTGSRQGMIAACIGLLIAQLIMTLFFLSDQSLLKAFFWFSDISYGLNLLAGALILLLSGYAYGQLAGFQILIKKRNYVLTGCLCGTAALFTTAFMSGWTGFLREGLHYIGSYDNPFEDYILKPFFWIIFFGLIPALGVGFWLGWRIKRKGQQKTNTSSRTT